MVKVSLGIDVGTASARCAVFSLAGQKLGFSVKEIKIWEPMPEFYEQSSDDIWQACCLAVADSLAAASNTDDGKAGIEIVGLSFAATCSLVVLGSGDSPVTVDLEGDPAKNVIVWLDHRATAQAKRINATGHRLLNHVGGGVSPEMEMPKLLWIKEHLPTTYESASKFMDLADYLTYRATGSDVRSLCTVVCKWNYDASGVGKHSWDWQFMESIGLGDLREERIGSDVRDVGSPLACGVCQAAAVDLGVPVGTAVGVGAIDAHCGGLGSLGADTSQFIGQCLAGEGADVLEARMAIIAGTSCCHMASSASAVFVPGVWGPYFSAMVPGLHLNEGGQSVAGKLLDFIIESHPAYKQLDCASRDPPISASVLLNEHLLALRTRADLPPGHEALLAADLHVTPDFLGNRSPMADPLMRGGIVGLGLNSSLDDLARLYLATIQALALQTRHILEVIEQAGHPSIKMLMLCGGLSKNPVFVRELVGATRRPACLPAEDEGVLLGSAILGAVAAGVHSSVPEAMRRMCAVAEVVPPTEDSVVLQRYYEAKYTVFRKMELDQQNYRSIMKDICGETP